MRYTPHNYQRQAEQFILTHPEAAIFLGMGLGKTVITLSAIWHLLMDSFQARRVLVIAPLRVARDTWAAEAHKWDHLEGLTLAVAVGSRQQRLDALADAAFIQGLTQAGLITQTQAQACMWALATKHPDSLAAFLGGWAT